MKASPFCLFLSLAVAVTGIPTRRDEVLYPGGRGNNEDAYAQAPEFRDDDTSDSAAEPGGTEEASQGVSEGSRGVDQMRSSMPSVPYSSHDGQRSKDQDISRGRSASTLRNEGRNDGLKMDFPRLEQPDLEITSDSSEDTESKKNEQPQFPDDGGIEKAERRGLGARAPSRDSGSFGSAETGGTGYGGRMSLGRGGGGSQSDEQGPGSQIRGQYNRDEQRPLEVNQKSEVRLGNIFGANWLMNSTRTWTTPARPARARWY